MRTNSIENTRGKNRKHKSYSRQKSKSTTNDIDEKEPMISSSVDKIRTGHLATTPVSPVGNIVDMQGSLNHGSVDKNEDEKSESKNNINKDNIKDRNDCIKAVDNQETNKKQEIDTDESNKDVKNEIETIEVNNAPENINVENKVAALTESNSVEKEDAADQKITDESESSIKQSISENQGISFRYFKINFNNF